MIIYLIRNAYLYICQNIFINEILSFNNNSILFDFLFRECFCLYSYQKIVEVIY